MIVFLRDYQGHLTASTGRHFLTGEVASLEADMEKALIEAGHAERKAKPKRKAKKKEATHEGG